MTTNSAGPPALPDLESFAALVRAARSCRRFKPEPRPSRDDLAALVDIARLSPSGGNEQPLRYRLVWRPRECEALFPHTRWAALLRGWRPAPAERPTAYIVPAAESGRPPPHTDAGIAMQTLQLAATAAGWACCMLGSVDRPAIHRLLALPATLAVLYVVAVGAPAETPLLEEARGGDVAYHRDAEGRHHVPKRPLAEVLLPEPEEG